MSLLDFNRQLDAFRDKDITGELSTMMRYISLRALTGLVYKTPVDTGRARGNWLVTVDSINEEWSENSDKSGGSTISAGTSIIGRVRGNPFSVVTIQNNLPYIEALEDGHSKQAPGGMLTITVAEVEGAFQ